MASIRGFWRRFSGPTKVAIVCATIAILLTVVGQLRHPEQMTVRSVLMGILIGGGSWGLVSWAIAYAVWDVEAEIAADEEGEEAAEPPATEQVSATE
ncbi:MAG: hypothetical protein ACYC5O_19805 [Anaerolineae bacterium]